MAGKLLFKSLSGLDVMTALSNNYKVIIQTEDDLFITTAATLKNFITEELATRVAALEANVGGGGGDGTGYAIWPIPRNLTLSGPFQGSVALDGSSDVTLSITVPVGALPVSAINGLPTTLLEITESITSFENRLDTLDAQTQELVTAVSGKLDADSAAASAQRWTTARTLSLSGPVSGSVRWDGSSDADITVSIADGALSITQVAGLNQRLTDLETTTTTLGTEVTTLTSDMATQTGRVDALETAVAGKASAEALNTLTQRVSEVEDEILDTQAALATKVSASLLGAPNGVATLGADGKVPADQLSAVGGSVDSTDAVPEGATNLYFTDARARAAAVQDAISSSVTDRAPSQKAVYDALAGKSATGHSHDASAITTGKLSDARLPSTMSGKNFSGNVAVTVSGGDAHMTVSGDAGRWRYVRFSTGGVARWDVGADTTAESNNSGSAFFIHRFSDAGGYLGRALEINRANGNAKFEAQLSTGGALYVAEGSDGEVSISPDAGANGRIEIGRPGRAVAGNPYIDFHSAANSLDYDARIVVSGGSSAQVGQATMNIVAATLQVNGNTVFHTGAPPSYSQIGSKPTTLSGYGITDATPSSHMGSGGSAHAVATTSAAGFMSAADKSKLDGIAAGATANATDAQLRDRSTHTGTQAISTVSGLQTALDGKMDRVPGDPFSDANALSAGNWMGTSSTGTPANTPTGEWTALLHSADGGGNWGYQLAKPYFRDELYLRSIFAGNKGNWLRLWHAGNLNPASFAAASHTHEIGQVTGLQTALDGKFDKTGGQISGAVEITGGPLGGGRIYAGWDAGVAGGISCNNWFRTTGQTGIYFSDYVGGWYMTDSTYVRTYNNKQVAAADFVISSDARLKTAIRDFEYKGRLRPVQYVFKKDGRADIGFIAQEVQELYPTLVGEIHTEDGSFLQLSYPKITVVLSQQINRVEDEVEVLKAKNTALEARVETLESQLAELHAMVKKLMKR